MKKIIIIALIAMLYNQGFSQNRLTPELLWKMGRVSEMQVSPDLNTVLYGVTFYDLASNKGNRDLYIIPAKGGKEINITNSPGSEWNALWRPDGKKIAYISAETGDGQIWEMDPDGSNKKQVSNIEGGISGFSYAPDQKHIMFFKDVKLDQDIHDVYPDLPKANAIIADDMFYRHWDSWHDYAYSHIFIAAYNDGVLELPYDIMSGEKFDAPLRPFGGIEQISWSPDGQKLAYTCRKLSGREETISTNSDIYLYDLSAKTTILLSEGMPGYDMDPVFSPDGKKIAWCSMKTAGFESDKKRLIIHDFETHLSDDLTKNFEEGVSNICWDKKNREMIYFISGINATYQVFSLNMKSGEIIQLTHAKGDYTELYSDGSLLLGACMSMSQPTELFRIEKDKPIYRERQITFTNKALLDKIELGKVESRWVGTSDGKKMLVWIILPPGFDKSKKYPALLYCQGGPQSAVSQFWSYRWNFQMMASNDYVVVAPNRRGLPSFGQEWNDQISCDYGGQNMLDYFAAIDTLSQEPWIDKDRLGAVGASYGGFSVYWLAGNHNKRFKAFIAHCGMFNLESWYGSTEELWFANHDLGGPYWKKPMPKSYDFSPHKFVGNWDTPILVIHGGRDFRIPYTEGMQAFDAAQLQGIPSRFLFFPDESHFVSKPQNSVLWQREFFRWLDQWLK